MKTISYGKFKSLSWEMVGKYLVMEGEGHYFFQSSGPLQLKVDVSISDVDDEQWVSPHNFQVTLTEKQFQQAKFGLSVYEDDMDYLIDLPSSDNEFFYNKFCSLIEQAIANGCIDKIPEMMGFDEPCVDFPEC